MLSTRRVVNTAPAIPRSGGIRISLPVTWAKAATTAEQFVQQMHTAMRDSRAAGLKAAQTLAESYAALVSGVLIGMSDALTQGGSAKPKATKK